ncbi:hypothetical protein [uncultured Gammaproteobacteria bacterium]|jgi:putative transposase|nr:hypothetical protein [uncultured Gammaproteobacteria bacterium]CAC9573681.1 hypothetical protein [uncultured Gammaproteobacteria bacterium]CAC9576337.1 hypothetical protein [uncultured Gammaproteobacteria bacterium]CAC9580935.1 hypothetical protein [uncultured Gammaproteobacteria bacterium]CAC9589638.1 hypothetical protein [uncultured Gammaproteobacteria bacterium]
MVYMAAVIDWHSKAVLSHRISNTMDSQLVMSVLNDALEKHPHPEIFNTDQGSQYTSEIQRLKKRDEPQIISVLSASGEVQNAKGFI